MKNFKAFPIYILMFFVLTVKAQTNCSDALITANKNYEGGNFDGAILNLKPCIPSFNKEERFEAYRLLTLSYIYKNESAQADESMKMMLKNNPSYKTFPNPNDPAEFITLLNTYEVFPRLTAGIKAGVNFTNINVTKNFSPAQTRSVYEPHLGAQFGIALDYRLNKMFGLGLEGLLTNMRYMRTLDDVAGWKQEYKENLRYISIPLLVKFSPLDYKIKPYLQAGYAYNALRSTDASLLATDNTYGNTVLATTNPIERRNRTLNTIIAGAGIKYNVGTSVVFADFRYNFGLSPIVNSNMRFDDTDFIFNNQYVDDDLKFTNIAFSAGIALPVFYSVNKIK